MPPLPPRHTHLQIVCISIAGFLALLLIAGAASCSGLSTSGTKIYDGGSEVTLIGANYFGFNNGQKMVGP